MLLLFLVCTQLTVILYLHWQALHLNLRHLRQYLQHLPGPVLRIQSTEFPSEHHEVALCMPCWDRLRFRHR